MLARHSSFLPSGGLPRKLPLFVYEFSLNYKKSVDKTYNSNLPPLVFNHFCRAL